MVVPGGKLLDFQNVLKDEEKEINYCTQSFPGRWKLFPFKAKR